MNEYHEYHEYQKALKLFHLDYAANCKNPRDYDEYQKAYKSWCLAMSAQCEDPLEAARLQFAAGDKSALLLTMTTCANMGLPVPRWVASALLDIHTNPPKSWDDVFGPPLLPKGKRAADAQRHRKLKPLIWFAVGEAQGTGRKIDDELFADVGKRFEISGATAKQIYYAPVFNRDGFLRMIEFAHRVKEAQAQAPTGAPGPNSTSVEWAEWVRWNGKPPTNSQKTDNN